MTSLNKSMKDKYQLALKLFTSRNFSKSYDIIKHLKDQAIDEFAKFNMDQGLLIKIVSLYLVEVGIYLSVEQTVISTEELNWLTNTLKSNDIIRILADAYGDENDIPSEIWYNYHLVFINNKELLLSGNKTKYLKDLNKLYSRLPQSLDAEDPFRKKFLDLFVFEILPTFDEFSKAEGILQLNALYNDNLEANQSKLVEVQKEKTSRDKLEQDRLKEQKKKLKEQQDKEVQREKDAEKNKNLKYRSVREIARQILNDSENSGPSVSNVSQSQIQLLRSRLIYIYNIVKHYLKTNYPLLAVLLVVLVGGGRYLSLKKSNVSQNLLETIRMAFKISYI